MEKFWEILGSFEKFGEILGDFATIYALLCGEKWSPKVHLWRKPDKYEVCPLMICNAVQVILRVYEAKRPV